MLRPDAFKQPYVAIRHIPYLSCDSSQDSSGGVLSRGQTVWTNEAYESKRYSATATAFVDEIGFVSLDSGWLVRADVLTPSAEANDGAWQNR